MKLHHVDSKQTMLSVQDILMVTAHESKDEAIGVYKHAGSPKDVTPERVLYTTFIKLQQRPDFVRIREGNTIALIVPASKIMCIMIIFNADKHNRFKNNLVQILKAAHKMGWKRMSGPLYGDDKTRIAYAALKHSLPVKVKMTKDMFATEFA